MYNCFVATSSPTSTRNVSMPTIASTAYDEVYHQEQANPVDSIPMAQLGQDVMATPSTYI